MKMYLRWHAIYQRQLWASWAMTKIMNRLFTSKCTEFPAVASQSNHVALNYQEGPEYVHIS